MRLATHHVCSMDVLRTILHTIAIICGDSCDHPTVKHTQCHPEHDADVAVTADKHRVAAPENENSSTQIKRRHNGVLVTKVYIMPHCFLDMTNDPCDATKTSDSGFVCAALIQCLLCLGVTQFHCDSVIRLTYSTRTCALVRPPSTGCFSFLHSFRIQHFANLVANT
jgi:hypothetical protein